MSVIQRFFPVITIVVCVYAYFFPAWPAERQTWIVYLLGAVMFCMGISLTVQDFKHALERYPLIIFALLLQFGLMPLIAWQLSTWAGLSVALTAGMILVGSVPGGTASNVICYLSKGDVALSITITTISTFLAIVVTPLLAYAYLNHTIEISIINMMWSIFYIVGLPVSLGVALNHFASIIVKPLQRFAADTSILLICLIIAIIVALNKENLLSVSLVITGLVLAHNLLGLFIGYILTLLLTRNKKLSKTIAIEVGMQNSGLAVALAVKFFTPATALPGALFSIIHNVTGSIIASYWAKK